MWQGLPRPVVFSGLLALAMANGIVSRIDRTVRDEGLALAAMNTFEISAIVWASFAASLALLWRLPREPMRMADSVVACVVLALIAVPASPASWLGLTLLSLHLIHGSRGEAAGRADRAGWIMLALTGSMLWGNLLLSAASGPVLAADAVVIGLLFGSTRVGNTLGFADGSGFVWIAPSCSSMANVSLAILCWVLVMKWQALRWTPHRFGWLVLACASAAAVNLVRIGLITLRPEAFDVLHGPVGAAVAGWVSLAAVVGISVLGTRDALVRRG